ncbi:general stress protein [uncultured Kocuria sp.]|uniref:general stress protein n=1 Tax=uncultured Kocuria sp. TaxID=259305 RepID=UPI0026326258|nr:general stress protein [uncultured Kocuria sp.]
MSSPRSLPPASATVRGLPRGEVIGRYGTYVDAQKAVDHLADEQFEVDRIAIVGNDLKSVEQVTGRLSYPKVAGQGALNGMVFGAFLGMILSLLGGEQWLSTLLVSVLMGGAFWMLLATITYAMQRGKRDFTSTNQIVATSYDVVAAPEVAQRAQQVLQGLRGLQSLPRAATGPRPGPQQGPQHGSPQSQPPGRPSAGAPWQRPSYGAPAGAPGERTPGPEAPPEGQGERTAAPGPSATFQDLPDGRPQYGIRLPAGRPAGDGAGQETGGQGPAGPGSAGPGSAGPGSAGQDPAAGGSTSADASR